MIGDNASGMRLATFNYQCAGYDLERYYDASNLTGGIMQHEFEAQAYDAACRIMGEAVWELVSTGQRVTRDAIANMIVSVSPRRDDLAASIALSVLLQA